MKFTAFPANLWECAWKATPQIVQRELSPAPGGLTHLGVQVDCFMTQEYLTGKRWRTPVLVPQTKHFIQTMSPLADL